MNDKTHVESSGIGVGGSGFTSYLTGFALSILFTLLPYHIVVGQLLDGMLLVLSLVVFAIAQLLVQLYYFLHFGRGSDARWNVVVFLFMILIVLIVVVGSLWIMNNLNYNMMMSPEEMDAHMLHQGQKGF